MQKKAELRAIEEHEKKIKYLNEIYSQLDPFFVPLVP
jgi:hypothetical protein